MSTKLIYSLWFKTKFHNDNLKKAVEIKADIPAKIELWGIGTAVWKYSLNTVKTQLSQNILSCKLNCGEINIRQIMQKII